MGRPLLFHSSIFSGLILILSVLHISKLASGTFRQILILRSPTTSLITILSNIIIIVCLFPSDAHKTLAPNASLTFLTGINVLSFSINGGASSSPASFKKLISTPFLNILTSWLPLNAASILINLSVLLFRKFYIIGFALSHQHSYIPLSDGNRGCKGYIIIKLNLR